MTVVPITAATDYQVVLPDQLSVTADEPYDTVWVGVSSADAQAYIPDQMKNRPWQTGMNFARRCWGNTDMRPATNGAPFFRTESDNVTIRKLCIASLIQRMSCPRSRWRHWRMARFAQSLAEPSGKSLSEFRRP